MPKTVTAAAGDTLCGLATQFGFLHCGPLRADPANADFLNRPLKEGDIVTVPDKVLNVLQKAAEKLHIFKRKGIPAPAIRFVHGSPDKPYKDDFSLISLNISNYVSDKGGADGTADFPTGFGYDVKGHSDPDTFKVEVVEPSGGANVMVDLEALKPLYGADGSVTGHESFSDAQAGLRKIKVQCRKVSNSSYKGYRSRYLRLVADEVDMGAISGDPARTDGSAQGLFTSDMANGNGDDADKVEILEQHVRATYTIMGCKAADPNKCKIQAELELAPDRRRIALCFHVFRQTVGVAGTRFGGVTDKGLRRRTGKWYRRAYAQAGLAPILVDPKIEELDPIPDDMLVIGQPNGGSATGLTPANASSSLSCSLQLFPAGAGPPKPAVAVNVDLHAAVAANGGAPLTAAQVAAAVVAKLPAGFSGEVFAVQPSYGSVSAPVDIVISHSSKERVVVLNETCNDAGVGVTVARVSLGSVDAPAVLRLPPYSPSIRRICHAGTIARDQMDCFVIGAWSDQDLRGFALIPDQDLPATHQAQSPVRWSNIMSMKCNSDAGGPFAGASIATLDVSDSLPYTYPHESGHVMMDAIHAVNNDTELMRSGTVEQNELRGTKRICDDPIKVEYQLRGPHTIPAGGVVNTALNAVDRLKTRGAQVIRAW